jgi:predicted CXXCH cytochrome family protein
MRSVLRAVMCAVFGILFSAVPPAADAVSIVATKHNLSVSGPGPIKAQTETRVCSFCHTPHNAKPNTPLWNRDVGTQSYILYSNPSSMRGTPSQPNGPSRLCLSCHDGTIALGAVLQPSEGISMIGQIAPGGPSNIGGGGSLSGDHPLLRYDPGSSPDKLKQVTDLVLYTESNVPGYMECTTCHDAHEDRWLYQDTSGNRTGKFLVINPINSGLCLTCHNIPDWYTSAHGQSVTPINGTVFPVAPRTWPTAGEWTTVGAWGCAICHTSHSSPSGQWLLYYPSEAEVCAPCHGSTPPSGDVHTATSASTVSGSASSVASGNIMAQTTKMSAHRISTTSVSYQAKQSLLAGSGPALSGQVTCSDCHNPHVAPSTQIYSSALRAGKSTGNARALSAVMSGNLKGVSGVDRNGMRLASANYEYEVCFKCHADYAMGFPFVPRVINTTNMRLEFDTNNPSFHPVEDQGKNLNIPSIPSPFNPSLTASDTISCTDCHSDEGGQSQGPHGSNYPPILKERYETIDFTTESYENYALCYRCHNRDSIVRDDSFKKNLSGKGGHSGHLALGAPCSACHTAHGIKDNGLSGSHTHLINFDTRIVSPKTGNASPTFSDNGFFSGSCTLVCHGKIHDNESYPQSSSPSLLRQLSPKGLNRPLR